MTNHIHPWCFALRGLDELFKMYYGLSLEFFVVICYEWKATHLHACTSLFPNIFIHDVGFGKVFFGDTLRHILLLPVCPLLLVRRGLADVQTKTLAVKVDLIAALLQDLCDIPCVLKLPEVDVTPALLDGVTNQLGGAGLTLGANDGSLLLLTGLVNDESGTLGLLLCDLLGFYGGGELGREGEVLSMVRRCGVRRVYRRGLTVRETSSNMMLNLAALRTRLSRTNLLTFSRCVMS